MVPCEHDVAYHIKKNWYPYVTQQQNKHQLGEKEKSP